MNMRYPRPEMRKSPRWISGHEWFKEVEIVGSAGRYWHKGLGTYLSFRFLLIVLCGPPGRQSPLFGRFSFLFFGLSLSMVILPRLGDVFVQTQRSSCVSLSWRVSGYYIYLLFVWSNFIFLHNSQWITFPNQLRLDLYSFCANLLHLLIMWLIVLSPSLLNLHFLICYVLSVNIVCPYGVALCCY